MPKSFKGLWMAGLHWLGFPKACWGRNRFYKNAEQKRANNRLFIAGI